MKTYQERVNAINTVDDIDKQLRLAKQTCVQIERQLKQPKISEQKRAQLQTDLVEAGRILRNLRHSCWDIEDEINAKEKAKCIETASS